MNTYPEVCPQVLFRAYARANRRDRAKYSILSDYLHDGNDVIECLLVVNNVYTWSLISIDRGWI